MLKSKRILSIFWSQISHVSNIRPKVNFHWLGNIKWIVASFYQCIFIGKSKTTSWKSKTENSGRNRSAVNVKGKTVNVSGLGSLLSDDRSWSWQVNCPRMLSGLPLSALFVLMLFHSFFQLCFSIVSTDVLFF